MRLLRTVHELQPTDRPFVIRSDGATPPGHSSPASITPANRIEFDVKNLSIASPFIADTGIKPILSELIERRNAFRPLSSDIINNISDDYERILTGKHPEWILTEVDIGFQALYLLYQNAYTARPTAAYGGISISASKAPLTMDFKIRVPHTDSTPEEKYAVHWASNGWDDICQAYPTTQAGFSAEARKLHTHNNFAVSEIINGSVRNEMYFYYRPELETGYCMQTSYQRA